VDPAPPARRVRDSQPGPRPWEPDGAARRPAFPAPATLTPVHQTAEGSSNPPVIGRVAEVWRYPVKSLGGEQLDRVRCQRRGLSGDRHWAVVGEDGVIGSGKTTRRFRRMPGLLSLAAQTDDAGTVWVELPDGRRGRAMDPTTARWLCELTGQAVHLAEESETSHFDDAPLHLVTTGALEGLGALGLGGAAADRRRFRPNLVIEAEGTVEPPCRLLVGTTAVLALTTSTIRCVMTTLPQPGLPFTPGILKRLEQDRQGCFGVYARVEQEGEIAVGDPVAALR
jgi:uncharacterized protein